MNNIAIIFLTIGFILLFVYFVGSIIINNKIDKINKNTLRKNFNNNIKNIAKEFDNKEQERIRIQNQKIIEKVHQLQELANKDIDYYTDLQKQYKDKVKNIQYDYEKEVEKLNQQKYLELNKTKDEVDKEINEVKSKYTSIIKNYELLFADKEAAYKEKIKELDNKIIQKKIEVQNLIENFKRDEEIRQEQDFFRITIDDNIKDDISKLKDVAMRLNNPSSLLKFVWKDCYENSFNQMIGRVLGKDAEKSGIYKITNLKNQMCYIGQSVNIKNRWRQHCKRGIRADSVTNNRLYDTMWTEGLENFTFQVVEFCDKDRLTEREKFYIDFYDSKSYGYNSKT